MPNLVQKPLMYLAAKVGSCATCMRQSLEAALVAWILFALTVTYYPGATLLVAIEMAASALSVLWLVHVATYAARTLNRSRVTDERAARRVGTNVPPNELGRRSAIGVLLRGAAIGAVSSLPVVLRPGAAFAFCGQCTNNSDCGVSPCRCVNTAPVNSGQVCNECKC